MKTLTFDTIPNRRGTYKVLADFLNDSEVVNVIIMFDVDEENDIQMTDRYGYIVESLDGACIYDGCWGFKTIKDLIPNIPPRLKAIG